jgi:site-specific DNA recombinase
MLTVAYCRVSTEEQAAEGFSIDGQIERLGSYADLHGLGDVRVVADPGRSGKNLERPGLQQLLSMVEAGHVGHVLVWRLDRLSRNLSDLILLADQFGQADVALHSFTEKLDLSSATGRMFYNILGSFAQFYREQLAENTRLGMRQAVREGKWINHPKTGYDLVDGKLVPNADAARVRQAFRLRAEGCSYQAIQDATGIHYSTARGILASRIYVGEVQLRDEWFPGNHEPLVSEDEFRAAHRGHIPGRKRGRHVLSGRVRCGICGRVASVQYGPRTPLFRCRHRGEGCDQPARSVNGLVRAALLGLRLIGQDSELRRAIRDELSRAVSRQGDPRPAPRLTSEVRDIERRRRKLLDLYYSEKISSDLFEQEEARLTKQIESLRQEADQKTDDDRANERLLERFEEVAAVLAEMDIERLWEAATEQERRVLVEEMVEAVAIFPDHLEVKIEGAPKLNIALREVGLLAGVADSASRGGESNP